MLSYRVNKSEREKNTVHEHIYVEPRNRFQSICRARTDLPVDRQVTQERSRGCGELRDRHRHTHTSKCKTELGRLRIPREVSSVSCEDQEVRMVRTGDRLKRQETDVYLSLMHTAVHQKPTKHCEATGL